MPPASHKGISAATVRPVSLVQARAIIEKYEYLGSMPAVARYAFGLFFGDRLSGAVVYGDEYTENRGVWNRYGFGGKIIALLRGVCLPWAHPGEIGTVYQACGFDYVGQMYRGTRALIHYEGRVISERQAKRKFGTCGRRALARLGIRSHLVPRRSRYFAFRGDRREQAALRAAIADRLRPYPKRQAT
jgi:hypothetical protein